MRLTMVQIYMHHVLTVDRSKPPPTFVDFCPERPMDKDTDYEIISLLNPLGMLFLGGGNDGNNVRYSTPDPRVKSGYYIKNNTFAMTADLVNYTYEKKIIYVTFDVEYLPGKIGNDASSTLISVTGCGAPGFMDENPVSNLTSADYTMRQDGWIVNASELPTALDRCNVTDHHFPRGSSARWWRSHAALH